MADSGKSYVPAELSGDRYRPIGGIYDSFDKAVQAMEQHFRNRHGGAGAFRIFKPAGGEGPETLVEVASMNHDPMVIRAMYKILEQPAGR